MAIKVIDTSVLLRTVSNVASHVEMDIVDASGNYKFFEKYDTLKYVVDPSVITEVKKRPMDHFYIDPSIGEYAREYSLEHYMTDGQFDRTKLRY